MKLWDDFVIYSYWNIFEVNLEQRNLDRIDDREIICKDEMKELRVLSKFRPFKIYGKQKRAIVIPETSKVQFVDYHQGPKMVAAFDQGQYHDFEWVDEYFVVCFEKGQEYVRD